MLFFSVELSDSLFIFLFTGPYCKNRHRRRVLCPNFIAGFCKVCSGLNNVLIRGGDYMCNIRMALTVNSPIPHSIYPLLMQLYWITSECSIWLVHLFRIILYLDLFRLSYVTIVMNEVTKLLIAPIYPPLHRYIHTWEQFNRNSIVFADTRIPYSGQSSDSSS